MELDDSAVRQGARLIAFDSIGSTNAEALRLGREGERGPLWIVAAQQTAGRGRRGSAWISERGNLYASLMLTNPSAPGRAAELSFVAALALSDALVREAAGLADRISLKWPNDVLIDGCKIAGILIEGENAGAVLVAVIGLGVNCAHHPADTNVPSTDLAALGYALPPARLFRSLSATMAARIAQWRGGEGFAPIRADWLKRAWRIGESIVVRLEGREMQGSFENLDERGRLVLRLSDGRCELIAAGEIFPLGSMDPAAAAQGRAQ